MWKTWDTVSPECCNLFCIAQFLDLSPTICKNIASFYIVNTLWRDFFSDVSLIGYLSGARNNVRGICKTSIHYWGCALLSYSWMYTSLVKE